MKRTRCPALYKEYHLDRGDERVDLFRKLVRKYGIRSALYPGSFVHIAPSFVIPRTVHVDSFREAKTFFADSNTLAYIVQRKEYDEEPHIGFYGSDYNDPFGEEPESFDLLISSYAGFVSPPCKRYLRLGGLLVANDSHGDASMAFLDPDFELIAVANRRGEKFTISETELERYFIPKRAVTVTPQLLRETGKGVAYTKRASSYIFRKIA